MGIIKNIKNDRSYLILFILFLSWILGQCDKTAINVAAIPISAEFGFNEAQIGLIMSSFFLCYALMTLFGGLFADKFGATKVIAAIMLLWSVFTGLTGFAWSLASLIAVRAVFGLAEGGFGPVNSVMVAELFPKEQRGRAKSFLVSAGQIGSAISAIAVAGFIATVGWRYAFWTYSILGILLGVTFIYLVKKHIKVKNSDAVAVKTKVPLRNALKLPLVWKLMLIQFSMGTFGWGLTSWLPIYWVKAKGINIVTMGFMTAAVAFTSFLVMNVFGWVIDKYMRGREKYLAIGCFGFTAVLLFLMYNANSVVTAFIFLTFANFAMSVVSQTIYIIPLKYIRHEFIGTASSLANFGAQVAGILAPTLFGYFISASGGSYAAVFGFVIATCVIALIVAATVNTGKLMDSEVKAKEHAV